MPRQLDILRPPTPPPPPPRERLPCRQPSLTRYPPEPAWRCRLRSHERGCRSGPRGLRRHCAQGDRGAEVFQVCAEDSTSVLTSTMRTWTPVRSGRGVAIGVEVYTAPFNISRVAICRRLRRRQHPLPCRLLPCRLRAIPYCNSRRAERLRSAPPVSARRSVLHSSKRWMPFWTSTCAAIISFVRACAPSVAKNTSTWYFCFAGDPAVISKPPSVQTSD